MAFKMKGHALPGFKQRTVSTISDSLDTAYDDKYENIFSNISDDLDAKIDSINTAKQAEIDAQNEAVIQGHIDEQVLQREEGVDEEQITCAAVNKSGNRCGKKVLPGQSYCTIHEKVEQRPDGKKSQCTHIKATGDRCKMQTTNKSGKCYYHD